MFADADQQLAAWAAAHDSVFSLEDALSCGLTETQVHWRSMHVWWRLHEGVFCLPGSVRTVHSRLRAACLAAESKPAAVSHRAAAALYELPGGRSDLVEITCRRWKRTRKPLFIVHESTRFSDDDIDPIDGIPVVTPERLVLELAGLRPYLDYVERVIQAARRKRLITYDSTLATFNRLRRRGVPGVRVMREALELWDPSSRPTQSEMETLLLQALRAHGLPEPIAQFDVLDEYGNAVATTDFALAMWKITIEYDSNQEHSDEFQIARGDRRRNKIVAAGYKPLTARYNDLRNGGHVLIEEIRAAVRSAAS